MYLVFMMTLFFTFGVLKQLYQFREWKRKKKNRGQSTIDISQAIYDCLHDISVSTARTEVDMLNTSSHLFAIRSIIEQMASELDFPDVGKTELDTGGWE